jgi:Uma2 family endonuclease
MATAIGLTIEEFEQLPDVLAHNRELVNGELIDVSGNVGGHVRLRDALNQLAGSYVRQQRLGLIVAEQEFEFGEDVHGPDISFLCLSKTESFDNRLRVQRFVPDLAIEIASKSDGFDALLAKVLRYRNCGTSEVWIFSILTRQAFVYSERPTVILGESQDFQSPLIPGFSIRLSDLFAMI